MTPNLYCRWGFQPLPYVIDKVSRTKRMKLWTGAVKAVMDTTNKRSLEGSLESGTKRVKLCDGSIHDCSTPSETPSKVAQHFRREVVKFVEKKVEQQKAQMKIDIKDHKLAGPAKPLRVPRKQFIRRAHLLQTRAHKEKKGSAPCSDVPQRTQKKELSF